LIRRYAPNRPTPKGWGAVSRAPTNLLDRYPVDVLVIDRSEPPDRSRSNEPDWFRWLRHTPLKNLSRVVLEVCFPAALVQHDGGRDKGLRKRMLALGYCQRCALVSNTDEGGAVAYDRLVTSYTLIRSLQTRDPEVYDPFTEAPTLDTTGPPRVMSNLLRPCNVPRTAYQLPLSEKERSAPDSGRDPMPPRWGAATQNQKGVRRLLPDEFAKGLGVPAEWEDLTAYPGFLLNHLSGIHTWKVIGRAIVPLFEESNEGPMSPPGNQLSSGVPSAHRPPAARSTHTVSQFHSEEGQFEWVKHDLSSGSPWHFSRIYNLIDACNELRDRKQQFSNGLADLDRHRDNYGTRRYLTTPSDLVGISQRAVDRAANGMSDELPDSPQKQRQGARQRHDR
jgi:hypothetical protein